MSNHSAADLARLLHRHGPEAPLMHVLEELQAQYRYLSPESMILVGECLRIPLSQVYSVATFYHAFSLEPRGVHTLLVCTGTACHVRGGQQILNRLETQLGVAPGGTTQDGLFTLETGNCLGACALGPVVVLDGEYEGKLSTQKVDRMLKRLSRAAERTDG